MKKRKGSESLWVPSSSKVDVEKHENVSRAQNQMLFYARISLWGEKEKKQKATEGETPFPEIHFVSSFWCQSKGSGVCRYLKVA